ncbi:MAG TPA: putative metallopeptidase [Ignavibacteriales bacterium]|nr:putative metallopeptidase [Ignavibacteriales bacterium]
MENQVEYLANYAPKEKKGPVKKEFEVDADMRNLAGEVIREMRLDVHPAKIEFLRVSPYIQKTTAAVCKKTGPEFKFFTNHDYLIEVSAELWDALDKDTRKILLEHELRHILVLQNDKTGDWNFKLRKHDIQDFASIVKVHGVDWIKRVKLSISSLYDLTPAEEDNIQI